MGSQLINADVNGHHRAHLLDEGNGAAPVRPKGPPRTLGPWLRAQSVNFARHAAALRPFRRDEFGDDAAAPTEGHIQATNRLLSGLRRRLLNISKGVTRAARAAEERPTTNRLQATVRHKASGHRWVGATEQIWDHYFELFSQRQTHVADMLLSCDRIALDCYQVCYLGIGKARPVPAPPPFSYMRRGRSPATFRRGIPLRRLGRRLNPFPLIQLPYHRLVNPWTLGAVLHEVSHNLQNDLGLARSIPRNILINLVRANLPRSVARVWQRWNRETFADLSGLLLGGPEVVASLMDVIARSPEVVFGFNPRAVHPTPYLRTLISVELLKRMGFTDLADQYRRHWQGIYPQRLGTLPNVMWETYPEAIRIVVETVCYQKYPSLGDKSLSQVIPFAAKDQQMIEEASARLALGTDPGVLPERFYVGAARIALDRGLARPGVIVRNFYRALARR
jgi:hypothetical protein